MAARGSAAHWNRTRFWGNMPIPARCQILTSTFGNMGQVSRERQGQGWVGDKGKKVKAWRRGKAKKVSQREKLKQKHGEEKEMGPVEIWEGGIG